MNAFPVPAEQTHLTHPKYRADIDGLRAIAVLSVVGFHAFPDWIRGGFVGVDVFFVISGYLISSIILSSLEKGTFDFFEFYARRVRRIFPALILVLAASFLLGWFVLLPDEYKQLGKHMTASAGFVSNFFFWQEAGYFDNAAETKPLLHLWSLGIEEQFYIIWPLLLYFAWKWRLNSLGLVTAIIAASFAANVSLSQSDTIQTFYSPLSRFWELLMGGILAHLVLKKISLRDKATQMLNTLLGKASADSSPTSVLQCNIQSFSGALLIGLAVLLVTKNKVFPGWWALLPTVGAYLIISAGQHAWLNRVFLSNRVLVGIGVISYPLYLWHWPLLSFARIMEGGTPSIGMRLVAVSLASLFAWATYLYIEKPLRFGKPDGSKVVALTVLMVVLAALGYAAYVKDGYMDRIPEHAQGEVKSLGNAKFWEAWPHCEGDNVKNGPGGCRIMDPGRAPDVALLGDSHAMQLVFVLDDIYRPLGKNVIVMANPGCVPLLGAINPCSGYMNKALYEAMNSPNIKTIVLSNYWAIYIQRADWLSHTNNPSKEDALKRADDYGNAIYLTLSALVVAEKHVIFMVDPPELYFAPEECFPIRPVYLPNHTFRTPCAVDRAEFDTRTEEYHRVIKQARLDYPMVKFIDSYKYFCDKKYCYAMIDGKLLYRDDNHLNSAGAHYLANKIKDQVLQ